MQFLLKITYPHAKFNEAVRDGSIGRKMAQIIDDLQPRALYFTEMNGFRTTIAIVEIETPSRIPAIAEPLFLVFEAQVEFHCLMGPQELAQAGLESLGQKWGAV